MLKQVGQRENAIFIFTMLYSINIYHHLFRDTGDGSHAPLMSFKQFVMAQDDDIDDEMAVQRYKDYKIEYRRQQLSEFFVAHKDEEWYVLERMT